MNRRSVLQTASVAALASVAGCLSGVRDHFTGEFRTNAPIEIYSEAELPYNIVVEAHEQGTGRQTYDQSFNVIPGERVAPQNVQRSDQHFRVTRYGYDGRDGGPGEDFVATDIISADTQLVSIRIHDDDLELEVIDDISQAEAEQDELEEEADEANTTES
ncbi:hypothetical protein [Natronosalvus vescus]|uniref:hypothetical protein n=1 Tax=Natronosalvus vescus TaxID=2953881 RepID=UPI0020911FEB|nr:hypothetical protein [Natronosalvus vescus]